MEIGVESEEKRDIIHLVFSGVMQTDREMGVGQGPLYEEGLVAETS